MLIPRKDIKLHRPGNTEVDSFSILSRQERLNRDFQRSEILLPNMVAVDPLIHPGARCSGLLDKSQKAWKIL